MTVFMCHGCGTQYADRPAPPPACAICTDDRQYVEWSGQAWMTHEELAGDHSVRIEHDDDLLGVGITPLFAIPQRALHVADRCRQHPVGLHQPRHARGRRGAAGSWRGRPHRHLAPALLLVDGRVERRLRWRADPAPRGRPRVGPADVAARQVLGGRSTGLSPTVTLYHCPGHFPGSTCCTGPPGPADERSCSPGTRCTSPRTDGTSRSSTACPTTCRCTPTTWPASAGASTAWSSTTSTASRGG